MKNAKQIFEAELRKRHIEWSIAKDGRYRFTFHDHRMLVSLDNVSLDFERDHDEAAVVRFVDQALGAFELPGWEQARSRVFWSLEPSDHDFGDVVREPVTDLISKVLVYSDAAEAKVSWLKPAQLRDWKVDRAEVAARADANLNGLLAGKKPESKLIEGKKLAMIPVDSVFKASLILAPAFKQFVQAEVGWPVLAVVPCRDFVYVLAEKDNELVDRLGGVVQREYRSSGHPIGTEVLLISDEGIRAIGKFPE